MVGGATRLTESGLSIVEWQPVTGVLPPLSGAEWQTEFEKYQAIPQYRETQPRHDARRVQAHLLVGMERTGCSGGWSASHSCCRSCCFSGTAGSSRAGARLWAIFGLGALQGAVGWWMVVSGLCDG